VRVRKGLCLRGGARAIKRALEVEEVLSGSARCVFLTGFGRTLKKIYIAIMLLVAIIISSIIAYSYSMPRTQALKIEIDYNSSWEDRTIVEFQDVLYMRGSVMHVVDDPNQQSIQLSKDDSVVLKLLDYPSNVNQGYLYNTLNYNFVFLNGGSVQGDIAGARVSLSDTLKFEVPEDGYYVFELGVENVNAYFPGNSAGVWTFSVTVIHP